MVGFMTSLFSTSVITGNVLPIVVKIIIPKTRRRLLNFGCGFQNFLSLPMSNSRNLIQGQARFSDYNDVQECPLGCEASGALRKALQTGKTTNVTNGKI